MLLDPAGSVLLLQASDPADHHKPPWWEIPGGGMDRGESSAAAALRELREETGVRDGVRIGPCVWVQHAEFDFGGYHFDQQEFIHVAWCDPNAAGRPAAWRPEALEPLEAVAFQGMRWWALDELLPSQEPVVPARLREFLPALVAGNVPDEPIDIAADAAGDQHPRL